MLRSLYSHLLPLGPAISGLIVAPSTAFAISIFNYNTELHDRFADSQQFIAGDLDLSGVALSDNRRWVTMVSPNVFLTSNHFFPTDGRVVTFYGGNDPSGFSVTRTVDSSQRVAESDIRLGVLNTPLPSSIAYYDFARDPITNDARGQGPGTEESFSNSDFFEENAYFFGRSPSSFPNTQDMAVGRNVIDGFVSELNAEGSTGTIDRALSAAVDSEGSGNFVDHEAGWQVGDSGSPVIVADENGLITIVGTAWAIATSDDETVTNFMTYLGNYADEIDAFISANPVPEPRNAALLLACGTLLITVLRRRRAAAPPN